MGQEQEEPVGLRAFPGAASDEASLNLSMSNFNGSDTFLGSLPDVLQGGKVSCG